MSRGRGRDRERRALSFCPEKHELDRLGGRGHEGRPLLRDRNGAIVQCDLCCGNHFFRGNDPDSDQTCPYREEAQAIFGKRHHRHESHFTRSLSVSV
jgi:hypothetical protein